jgi:hypothetical protein
MIARWLYFDVPYAEDARIMRAIFGFSDAENKTDAAVIYPCKDIPEAIAKMEAISGTKHIALTKELVYVYPLDIRHGLAGIVRELADKQGCDFSRQIPKRYYPPSERLLLYSPFDDGSAEQKLDKPAAMDRVNELEQEAADEASYGDMLPVLKALRHALRLSVTHFGWASPQTLHVMYNMQRACRATGNDDNIFEANYLVLQFIYAFTNDPPSKSAWEKNRGLVDEFEKLFSSPADKPFATMFRTAFILLE